MYWKNLRHFSENQYLLTSLEKHWHQLISQDANKCIEIMVSMMALRKLANTDPACFSHMQQKRRRSACSLISAFVVHCWDSIIPLLAIAEISRPQLVSSAEQAGLSHTWSPTPKTVFWWRGSIKSTVMFLSFRTDRSVLSFDFWTVFLLIVLTFSKNKI